MPRWDITASQVEADTFWDAKGDLAVGSGADASVKLGGESITNRGFRQRH
jgi:hypothetical protein